MSSLRRNDALRLGTVGIAARPLRAAMSALGVGIGIAALVSVIGISQASQAQLLNQLDELGTNLLQVTPGQAIGEQVSSLSADAERAIERMGAVEQVSSVADVTSATVLRSRFADPDNTGGITVRAARTDLNEVLGGSMRQGTFLTSATSRYPVVVLGSVAAERLGIERLQPGLQVWLGDRPFAVAGIMNPIALASDVERSALIGYPVADELFDVDARPTNVYVRADVDAVGDVRDVLPNTADPERPDRVQVSRPSDVLEARAAAKGAFTTLLAGVGFVSLLVGGIGIANVMVIGVLERRGEIGLRRALGATRGNIRAQFAAESLVIAAGGGVGGALVGALVTLGFSLSRDLPIVTPFWAIGGGILASLVVGAIAGLYPAMHAAKIPPVEALRA